MQVLFRFSSVASLLLAVACTQTVTREAAPANSGNALLPVNLPSGSSVTDAVRRQLDERMSRVTRLGTTPGAVSEDAASAYGDLGKLLLAGSYTDAAVAAFTNAATLAPANPLWPYFLGHTHRERNEPAKAAQAFERVRTLDPNDVATLVWLGEVQAASGRPEPAVASLTAALARAPGHARALAALGAVEVTLKDYTSAVTHLQQALEVAPAAGRLHYQLSLAYRALGESTKADAELSQRGTGDVPMNDPRLDEVRDLLESAMAFDVRSREALARGQWDVAVNEARRGLELDGTNPSLKAALHHRIGTALAQTGNSEGARQAFETAVAIRPEFVAGRYSLALMLEAEGKGSAAVKELSEALRIDPSYLPARLARADMLREAGRYAQALAEYRIALQSERDSPAAQFGEALALVGTNRDGEALAALERAVSAHPSDDSLSLALARVLAGGPRDGGRDSSRALAIAEPIVRRHATLEGLDTLAFVLASAGRFEEAAALGQMAVDEARRQQLRPLGASLAERVSMYRQQQLPRQLWARQPLYEPTS